MELETSDGRRVYIDTGTDSRGRAMVKLETRLRSGTVAGVIKSADQLAELIEDAVSGIA